LEDVDLLLVELERNTPYELLLPAKEKAVTELYVDASLSGLGACIPSAGLHRAVEVVRLHDDDRRNIALLELEALEQGLVWARKLFPSGRLRVYTDNTNVLSWWSRGVGPTWVHCKILARLQALRKDVSLEYVPTKQNHADVYSRKFDVTAKSYSHR
jgi:hypothetical protein